MPPKRDKQEPSGERACRSTEGALSPEVPSLALMGLRPASAQTDYIAELHAKAKEEGEVDLVQRVLAVRPRRKARRRCSARRFPASGSTWCASTAQVAYQRLSQDIQASAANCDVFASTDMGQYRDAETARRC